MDRRRVLRAASCALLFSDLEEICMLPRIWIRIPRVEATEEKGSPIYCLAPRIGLFVVTLSSGETLSRCVSPPPGWWDKGFSPS